MVREPNQWASSLGEEQLKIQSIVKVTGTPSSIPSKNSDCNASIIYKETCGELWSPSLSRTWQFSFYIIQKRELRTILMENCTHYKSDIFLKYLFLSRYAYSRAIMVPLKELASRVPTMAGDIFTYFILWLLEKVSIDLAAWKQNLQIDFKLRLLLVWNDL